jgi:hypothetical protein
MAGGLLRLSGVGHEAPVFSEKAEIGFSASPCATSASDGRPIAFLRVNGFLAFPLGGSVFFRVIGHLPYAEYR